MRSVTRNRVIGTWAVCLLLAASPVFAQEHAEQPPSVGEIVKLAVASYRGLKTYQDSGQLTMDAEVQGQAVKREFPLNVTYAAGPRFKLKSEVPQVYCDGRQVTTYIPIFSQYIVEDYGPKFWQEGVDRLRVLPRALRLDQFFTAENPVTEYTRLVSDAQVKGLQTVGEYDCWVVQGHCQIPGNQAVQATIPLTLWHRRQDGLIVQVRADLTQSQNPAQFGHVVIVYNAGKIILNAELPPDAFVFQPPEGAEKVAAFGPRRARQADPAELEGKAAPDFELKALDGSTVKLSGLKGKVVVLDFWASWCGPCRQEMPELEQLWQKVKDKDVVIFGVNLGDSAEAAGKAADSFGVTFPIVLDSNGATGNAYGVSGIPTTVIIDGAGVVRGRHVGYRPGVGKQIEEEIEKLRGAE